MCVPVRCMCGNTAKNLVALLTVHASVTTGAAGASGTFWIWGSGGGPTKAASNADVAALFPSGYTKASSAPKIPGMTLSDPVAMAPKGAKGDQSVVVGQVKQGAANSTLLPTGFLTALGLGAGEAPPRAAVKLSRGNLQAYRYKNLRPRGLSKPVTIFTTPTSAGIATVACVDPTADCEAIANTLKLNTGTAFPVGPNKDYAAARGKTLGGLGKKASSAHTALQGAKTPKAQSAAAGQLASAYSSAAKSLGGLKVSPADESVNSLLASRLKQTGSAYAGLASAARSGNKAGYAKASKAVQGAEGGVAAALRGVQAAGYKVAQS